MNRQLINVSTGTIGGQPCQVVDARELHEFMEVGKVFAAWINERIQQYQFQEGQDYEVFSDSGKNPQGGRPLKNYLLTLDTAKELAMVERTPRGREARRYFIECEKELLRLKSGSEAFAEPLPDRRFDAIETHKLGKLHRLNRSLALAYLIENGITPQYVAGLLNNPEAAAADFAGVYGKPEADRAPLEVLRTKVPEYAGAQDELCWYLLRKDWETVCQGYSATRTARYLADLGLLRHDEGKLTMKAGRGLFGGQVRGRRPYVYAVRKGLAEGAGLPALH